jgi:hypothetical protein
VEKRLGILAGRVMSHTSYYPPAERDGGWRWLGEDELAGTAGIGAQSVGRRKRQPERPDLRQHGREQDEQGEVPAVLGAENPRRDDPADDERGLPQQPRGDRPGDGGACANQRTPSTR